jgi:hypothetical protein
MLRKFFSFVLIVIVVTLLRLGGTNRSQFLFFSLFSTGIRVGLKLRPCLVASQDHWAM